MNEENEGDRQVASAPLVPARKVRRRPLGRSGLETLARSCAVLIASRAGMKVHPSLVAHAMAVIAREAGVAVEDFEPAADEFPEVDNG